jgi:hypothetical protein
MVVDPLLLALLFHPLVCHLSLSLELQNLYWCRGCTTHLVARSAKTQDHAPHDLACTRVARTVLRKLYIPLQCTVILLFRPLIRPQNLRWHRTTHVQVVEPVHVTTLHSSSRVLLGDGSPFTFLNLKIGAHNSHLFKMSQSLINFSIRD